MNMSGFGTMVDSVAAIKKVVYTDHKATLAQVRDACMANFQGYEDLRIQLQAAPSTATTTTSPTTLPPTCGSGSPSAPWV